MHTVASAIIICASKEDDCGTARHYPTIQRRTDNG